MVIKLKGPWSSAVQVCSSWSLVYVKPQVMVYVWYGDIADIMSSYAVASLDDLKKKLF